MVSVSQLLRVGGQGVHQHGASSAMCHHGDGSAQGGGGMMSAHTVCSGQTVPLAPRPFTSTSVGHRGGGSTREQSRSISASSPSSSGAGDLAGRHSRYGWGASRIGLDGDAGWLVDVQ